MSFKNGCLVVSICAAIAGMLGCGDSAQPEEPVASERQALSVGDSIPWFVTEIPVEWGCDQTIEGRFHGLNSAHMYRFPGKIGYRYNFEFTGNYPAHKGAVIAVYDTETGTLVAADHEYPGNAVGLVYEAEKSIDYLVAVFTVAWRANGTYTLSADCELTKYCVEYETTDPDGTPYNNFYAQNVTTYEEGKQLLAQVQYFFNEDIRPGSCASQSAICPTVHDPVCGDSPVAQTEYDNVCVFKSHIRQTAGESDQWKGHWEQGTCDATGQFCGGIGGLPCPDGFVCVLEGDYPDAGGSCQPTTCTYDGVEYAVGDSFPALDGCNVCSCTAGGVACTKMYCGCDPQNEWWRDYRYDPATCEVIRYYCPPNMMPFSNECGCGCQQDESCPEWFDCMPPTTCDVDAIQSECPLSQIAY